MSKLKKPQDKISQLRFVGVNTFMKLPLVEDLQELGDEHADYAIIGFPTDGGCSYRSGQRFAPNYIRELSGMLRPINIPLDVDVFNDITGFDHGDINCNPMYNEMSHKRAVEKIKSVAQKGIVPITLGGDHMITMASLQALAEANGGPIGLIHWDSHTDTWPADGHGGIYNNGTSLYMAVKNGWIDPERTISVGIKGTGFMRDEWDMSRKIGIKLITMDEFEEIGIKETIKQIKERVGSGKTFMTFDIDCVSAAYAPGGELYEPCGFTDREVFAILNQLTGIQYVGFDIAEVDPPYDNGGQITGYLAAAIVHNFIAHVGVMKREQNNTL